jgi:hypothetical protein
MTPFLNRLNEAGVRYVVIGGHALRVCGMPRFTMDWDLCIPPRDEANFDRLNGVLEQFDELAAVPLGLRGEHFVQTYPLPWGVVQFHLRPIGFPEFDELEAHARISEEDGVAIRVAAPRDLLEAKRAINRPKDQDDILFLESAIANGGGNPR